MTIDQMLASTRARLTRVDAAGAHAAVRAGALLVDIRPIAQRSEFGEIPGALIIERNVLEWRLDPLADSRIGEADSHDRVIVIVCQQGYASSLATASLQDLGLRYATDLVGGFEAWRDAGLPVTSPRNARMNTNQTSGVATG